MNVLSIDWFQLGYGGAYLNTLNYDIKKLDYATRHFKIVEEIFYRKQKLFTVARKPHSNILPPDHHLIKFDNKFLYSDNAISKGMQHLSIMGLNYKNVTRIDLAVDFNLFKYGLKPDNFISYFLNGKYVHNGRAKFKIIGRQEKRNEYQYLRFGSPISLCSVYLYNKTIELKEEKFKQHIFNKWKKTGLNVSKDIWRLEFSIKKQNFDITDKATGETIKFDVNLLRTNEFLILLFNAAMSKYFQFKHRSRLSNKDRWNNVDLFDRLKSDITMDFRNELIDHDRSDKIFLRKLEHFNNELRGNDFELSTFVDQAQHIFIKSRKLEEYYETKIVN